MFDRLGAFSDGVFAIAATLLVLSLRTPHLAPGQSLLPALAAQWPQLLAYTLTFLTIGSSWLGHRAIVAALTHDSRGVQVTNLLVLLIVAALPFPTALIADLHAEPAAEAQAVALLSAALATLGLALLALDHVGATPQPRTQPPTQAASGWLTPGRLGPLLYTAAIPASLISPLAGLLIDLLTTLTFLLAPHRLTHPLTRNPHRDSVLLKRRRRTGR